MQYKFIEHKHYVLPEVVWIVAYISHPGDLIHFDLRNNTQQHKTEIQLFHQPQAKPVLKCTKKNPLFL